MKVFEFCIYLNDQLISFLLTDFRNSFAPEKHFELKNFVTENGEGWAHFRTL